MKPIKNFAGMILTLALVVYTFSASAQRTGIQYFRTPGQQGLNVFETPKSTDVEYDGLAVRVGGDLAIQFQGLDHSNDANNLVDLGANVNLPTANLNLDVQLAKGVRMNMVTYLSSRHHNDAWVKGGYLQIDRLDFIKEGFAEGVMDITTLRAGVDEPNYGDAHFRRSDNGKTIYNPFVGNYIMDAFTTEPFMEANLQPGDFLVVVGITNGMLNPTVNNTATDRGTGQVTGTVEPGPSIYGKVGYDNQINEDARVRLTASIYTNSSYSGGGHMYGGDRAGARYYDVMSYITKDTTVSSDFTSGRFNPRFSKVTNFQINPFVKYKGLEFFGIYEVSSGDLRDAEGMRGGSFTQLGAELLYRFGGKDQFYIGGRYNDVSGATVEGGAETNISRINVGGGWFMTPNVLMKAEYVSQTYDGAAVEGSELEGGQFSGAMVEAVIGF